ncbi:MAG: Crp/Fnr family transcriptional regulator [Deltaproteobacteria bacterium]|nr:Crp/Fnr family transcriptional regulator [Deltaproteobacteria bacterium]MCL5276573.1 Crp/Fnr family transcriptional regulator [Deltaproteobacteria bacterium]
MEEELFKRFGKVFPKGTILFHEGDTGGDMYIINTGRVKIFKEIGGMEKVLAVLGQSDFFGEMSLLNKKPRSASAEVVEDAKMLVINNSTFDTMIRGNAEIALRIIRILSKRLEDADVQIANLMIKDSNQRVLVTLLKLADNGTKIDTGTFLKADADSLAITTGLEKEKVKEIVERLTKNRLIEPTNNGILIRNMDNLKKYLDYLVMKEQFEGM